jgi:O-antigen/teichoic acid export membrane protein
MSYKRKIIRGFAISFSMAFAIAIIGYLTRMIFARNLTLKEYGLFYAVFSFVTFFNLFRDFGLNNTSIKFISDHLAKNDRKGIKTTIMTSFLTQFAIVSAISLGLIFSASYLSEHYFKMDAFYVILFMALSYFVSINQDITSTICSAFQNMFYANLSEFLRYVVIIIIFLAGSSFYKSASFVAFIYFISMFVLFFLHYTILKKFLPYFFEIKTQNKTKKLKQMLKFAFPIMISSVGGMIITYSSTMMLTYFKGLEDVALYNAAMPIAMILWYFGSSVTGIVLPVISEMWQKKEKEYVKEGISLLNKYCFALIIPFALVFVAFPEIIIRILFGEKFIAAANSLRILSIGAIVYNIGIINSFILVGIGKPKVNSYVMLFAAVFNVVFNILLIPKFGIAGAAATTATSYALIFVLNTYNLKKITRFKFGPVNYLKIFFGGFIFLASVYFLKKYLEMNAYVEAIVVCLISFSIYFAYLFLAKIIKIEEVKDIISRIRG